MALGMDPNTWEVGEEACGGGEPHPVRSAHPQAEVLVISVQPDLHFSHP